MTTNNMYRVGDFVYFETSVTAPYQIRKIEELNKTPQGAVEAKAICYYRRRDISKTLIQQAEKHRFLEDDEFFPDSISPSSSPKIQHPKYSETNDIGYFKDSHLLNPIQCHQAKHRELFLSRQIETLPATHIRGKCNVTLYNDAEPIFDYLNKEDTFFYKFTYDPSQKSLHADRNAIRVGSDFQTQVKVYDLKKNQKSYKEKDEKVYCPMDNNDCNINKFILISRSLGTLARAYEPLAYSQNPELLFSAASASRDFTLQKAHDCWYKSNYSIPKAVSLLLPGGSPKLFKDEMEQWTTNEYSLFHQGIEKYGKDFYTIRNQLLPWKSLKGIIEFYYMWKSTDKYWSMKRHKSNNVLDHKLKQVYIPSFLKPNPAVLCTKPLEQNSHGCESCLATKSSQWYLWGPQHLSCRLCVSCWSYWKRYGGLRNPASKELTNENGSETVLNLANGEISNVDNLNQVGNFKCTQQNCDKEFRVKSQLYRHLYNIHGVSQPSVINGSWDILNHYSKSLNNNSSANHLLNFPGGRGMLKPRSTLVFKINLRFRLGRVLLSDYIKPKHIAKKPNSVDSSDMELFFKEIEKFPFKSISNDRLNRILKFSLKNVPINDAIASLWKKKGITLNLQKPDFLYTISAINDTVNSSDSNKTSNGVCENTKSLSLKRPLILNGGFDKTEPFSKVGKQISDNGINRSDTNYNQNLHDSSDNSIFMHTADLTKS